MHQVRWSCVLCSFAAALVVCGALSSPAALGAGGEFVYLENTDSGDISVISIPDHEVVSTISIGTYLDDVTAASDGRIVYVNRIESANHPLMSKRAGETGEIIAISTETEQILWRTPVGGWPHHITLTADDKRLFVPLYDRMWIEIVDTQQHKVVGRMPTVLGSHGTRLSPDGRRLYVGSMLMDMLLVFDIDTLRPVKRLPFADAVRPFAFTRDEQTLYVQLSRLHGFQVVDLKQDKIVRQIDLPKLPADAELPAFYPHTYNHGLEITPDEKYLFAAGSAGNYVCVYELSNLELVATIPVGTEPNWIVFDRAGRFAYVSNRVSNTLSVVSVEELKELKQIPVGKYPQRFKTVVVPERNVSAAGR
jgi:YVTN family beta-propeller protein